MQSEDTSIFLSVQHDKSKDGVLLTLDAIKSSIRFQKSIADGWIKVLNRMVDSEVLFQVAQYYIRGLLSESRNHLFPFFIKTIDSVKSPTEHMVCMGFGILL